jgi:hypothetical protein
VRRGTCGYLYPNLLLTRRYIIRYLLEIDGYEAVTGSDAVFGELPINHLRKRLSKISVT